MSVMLHWSISLLRLRSKNLIKAFVDFSFFFFFPYMRQDTFIAHSLVRHVRALAIVVLKS